MRTGTKLITIFLALLVSMSGGVLSPAIDTRAVAKAEAAADQNSTPGDNQPSMNARAVQAAKRHNKRHPKRVPTPKQYPIHANISVTYFWIGEPASADNDYIPNNASAWDDTWQADYGGVDDPVNRNGYYPAGFIPKENPFYFALPYNDFNNNGDRKASASKIIYWSKDYSLGPHNSMLKNRWIKIAKGNQVVYAQWEDVGPNGENDSRYVFGQASPKNPENQNAGLDVSPAVRDYLHLQDIDQVTWQFVDASNVPPGPWTQIITTSGVNWK